MPCACGQSQQVPLALSVDIPNFPRYPPVARSTAGGADGDGAALLFVSLLCSSLHALTHPGHRLRTLDMLLALAAQLSDEARLDRVLPYLATLLSDNLAAVRAAAVRAIAQLLAMVVQVRHRT
jgi:phosphoinositide-3-kinase, regulatory subunit 4